MNCCLDILEQNLRISKFSCSLLKMAIHKFYAFLFRKFAVCLFSDFTDCFATRIWGSCVPPMPNSQARRAGVLVHGAKRRVKYQSIGNPGVVARDTRKHRPIGLSVFCGPDLDQSLSQNDKAAPHEAVEFLYNTAHLRSPSTYFP